MNRSDRTHPASGSPAADRPPDGTSPSPLDPLLDHGPLPLPSCRIPGPLVVAHPRRSAGFLAVALYVPATNPDLSQRGLLTIALAALIVVLLTLHRTAGPRRLARAAAEYTAVALLAALLTG